MEKLIFMHACPLGGYLNTDMAHGIVLDTLLPLCTIHWVCLGFFTINSLRSSRKLSIEFSFYKKKKKKFLITNQQTKNAQSNKHKSKNIYMKISTRNVYKFSLVFFLFFSGKNVLYIIITMNGFLVTKHHAIDFLFNKHQRLMASETLAEELNDSWDKSFVCVEKWKWSVGSDWCYFFKCKQINSKKKEMIVYTVNVFIVFGDMKCGDTWIL